MEPNKYDHHSVVSDGSRTTQQITRPDGSQDVKIEVKRLNLTNRTPEDDIAEKAIIEALKNKKVRVVVIYKPTNSFVSFICPITQVRLRAEQAIEKHRGLTRRLDYVIVEIDGEKTTVSALE